MSKYFKWNSYNGKLDVQIQTGAIKEVGVNGCQIDDIVGFAKEFIRKANMQFPCRGNTSVIKHLEEVEKLLKKRREDRVKRKVEGYNKV